MTTDRIEGLRTRARELSLEIEIAAVERHEVRQELASLLSPVVTGDKVEYRAPTGKLLGVFVITRLVLQGEEDYDLKIYARRLKKDGQLGIREEHLWRGTHFGHIEKVGRYRRVRPVFEIDCKKEVW